MAKAEGQKTFVVRVLRSFMPNSQRKVAKAGNAVMGKCLDCGKVILYRDNYYVRPAIWSQAGMEGYFAGFLHRVCLQTRLGRELTKDDLTAWFLRDTASGDMEVECTTEGRDFALRIEKIEKVSDILSTALQEYIEGIRQVEVGDDVILIHTTDETLKYRSPSLVKAVRNYEKTGKFQLGKFDLVPVEESKL